MTGTLGKYIVHRTLGSGASCKVKLGTETETGKMVAIKILNMKDLGEAGYKMIWTEI